MGRQLALLLAFLVLLVTMHSARANNFDFDNDGIPDFADNDDDNDGVPDDEDPDDDNDGVPDNIDDDHDNDGVPDGDYDYENYEDYEDYDYYYEENLEEEEDHEDADHEEADPMRLWSLGLDFDSDGIPDDVDPDDDNDGIPDDDDLDGDNDGIPDDEDPDDDNDGIPDELEGNRRNEGGSPPTGSPQNQEFIPMCNNENFWIRVDWGPPTRDTWMSCLLGYRVGFRRPRRGEEWTWMNVNEGTHRDLRSNQQFFLEAEGTNHSLTIRNLDFATNYEVVVKVLNPYGSLLLFDIPREVVTPPGLCSLVPLHPSFIPIQIPQSLAGMRLFLNQTSLWSLPRTA